MIKAQKLAELNAFAAGNEKDKQDEYLRELDSNFPEASIEKTATGFQFKGFFKE